MSKCVIDFKDMKEKEMDEIIHFGQEQWLSNISQQHKSPQEEGALDEEDVNENLCGNNYFGKSI